MPRGFVWYVDLVNFLLQESLWEREEAAIYMRFRALYYHFNCLHIFPECYFFFWWLHKCNSSYGVHHSHQKERFLYLIIILSNWEFNKFEWIRVTEEVEKWNDLRNCISSIQQVLRSYSTVHWNTVDDISPKHQHELLSIVIRY